MSTQKPILIIPARGGSKRLPRKNILPLEGRPVIWHVITVALKVKLFNKVIVSTEDVEIREVALNAGAEVFSRSIDNAQDSSTVVDVCLEVLDHFNADVFCCIYPTAALLSEKTITDSYHLMINNGANFVMGVSEYNYPPVQAMCTNENGFLELVWPEYKKVQSQNYPDMCVSNGTIYWAKKEALHEYNAFYGPHLLPFNVPQKEVCDINYPEDFERLKAMYLNNKAGH